MTHIFLPKPVAGNVISITGPGTFDGATVTMSPFGRPPASVQPTPVSDDFAATSVFGKQGPITIVFSRPVDFVDITAKSSTAVGNKMIAFDIDGRVLNETTFGKGRTFSFFGRRIFFGEFISQRRIEVPAFSESSFIDHHGRNISAD